jgi:hypothetical protein
MMEKSNAIFSELAKHLGYISFKNLSFGVNKRVERENQVNASVGNHRKIGSIIRKKLGAGSRKSLLAVFDAGI